MFTTAAISSMRTLERTEQLMRGGLLQLVTSNDYMNTHIRPWGSRRSSSTSHAPIPTVNCI